MFKKYESCSNCLKLAKVEQLKNKFNIKYTLILNFDEKLKRDKERKVLKC